MIDNIGVKRGFALLKWLPAVAAVAFVLVSAPKDALAQSTPSTIGYLVSNCGIDTENGDYYYIGPDVNGNPYYENAAGAYLYACGDDQDNDDFWRWYIGTSPYIIDGVFYDVKGGDYESGNAGSMIPVGPATPGWDYDDAPYQSTAPSVIAM